MDTDSSDSSEESTSLLSTSNDSVLPPLKVKQHSMLAITVSLIFTSYCIDSVLFPFFPNVGVKKGLLLSETGIVFSAFDFTRFVTAPIAGRMFDRCHPKKLCAIGATIAGLACISFGLTILVNSTELFFACCLAIRCVAGVGSAMLNVSGTSLLLKASGYETTTVVAFVETANKVGYAFGPAIGAFLYQFVGYSPMFAILGGTMLFLLPTFLYVVPKVDEKAPNFHGGFLAFLTIPGIFLMFLGWTSTKISATSRTSQLARFFYLSFHTSTTAMGLMFTLWAVCGTLGNICVANFVNKKYAPYILLIVWTMFVPVLLLAIPSPPISYLFGGKRFLPLSVVMLALLAWFVGFLHILCFSVALRLAWMNGYPENSLYTYGLLTGLMNSGLCLGSTIGPVLAGIITDYSGFEWTQTVNASLYTLMVILLASFLLYLKFTNQLSTLLGKNDKAADTEDSEHSVASQVAEACSERMKACLDESPVYTEVQPQPDLEQDLSSDN
ncbi:MFS-type transporter SLC18B1-like [Watersipora subatra]|uniref:MFS-type transporter SLC18B1-like n=1 Tax=Watersipora subatra TaxID=2589382 RepID=UPI00355C968D